MSRILITSALPYINGIKHLGNLVGSMLPADVYARFMRASGHDVLYICATDEHGTPAEIAAHEKGQDVATFCAEQHEVQKSIYQGFEISFDHFGRSSSKQNVELTQHLFNKLDEHGYIEERTIEQVYSNADGRYLPDRYVEGTCPKCGYEKARGDQCENCTSVLDPTDLKDPRSAISGSTDLEVRETKHLFLKLEDLTDDVEKWVDTKDEWPRLVTSIARKWIDEGLQNRCITRDLSWGVPVPREGFEDKVFYVWFDAPIEYIAATKEWSDEDPENRDYKDWWYDKHTQVHYVQFMAKDNIPFHTISFPATLIGTGEPWKKVDFLKGFNWLNYYGGKFSTSSKRGIFTNQALEEFDPDYWRYWLIANAPEGSDSSFTFDGFGEMINADLNDKLGNFVSRVTKLTNSKFEGTIPDGGEWTAEEEELAAEADRLVKEMTGHMEAIDLRKAIAAQRELWMLGNNYIATTQPWSVFKEDPERAGVILRTCFNLIHLYGVLAQPFIPAASAKFLATVGETSTEWPQEDMAAFLKRVPGGRAFEVPDLPFSKISADQIAALTEKYQGAA